MTKTAEYVRVCVVGHRLALCRNSLLDNVVHRWRTRAVQASSAERTTQGLATRVLETVVLYAEAVRLRLLLRLQLRLHGNEPEDC